MELKPGYKQTEVGVIPEEWDVKPLKMISSMSGRIGWQGLKEEEFTNNPDHPFLITGMNFTDGKISWEDVYHIPSKRYEEAISIQLRADDVLMTKDGTIGKLLYINSIPHPGKASLNSHLLVFRPLAGKYVPKFLFYQLASRAFGEYVELKKSGSTFFGLTQNAVGDYRAYLPPIPEQRAIAGVLSDVDALIGVLDRLIAKKRDIKQAAMQQLLTGKKRMPGFSGKWEVKRFGAIADIQRGASPRPIDSSVWYDSRSTVGWVRISDIAESDGRTLLKTRDYLSQKGIAASRFLPAGSLIMSICATVGRPVITGFDTCIHDGFVGFSNLRFIDKRFLFYKLKQSENDFKAMGQTGSQANLNTDLVNNCEVELPELLEQTAIATVLSDMDDEIAALEARRDKTRALKQGMMQELLTGRIRLV